MDDQDLLERVVENALDFLSHSLDDFKSHPKYSVINFHAGVELLLKARLIAEHWSLAVSKRQDPDWSRFESGDFISVSLDEAAGRLERVVRSALTKREYEVFRNLARHRNRMVHFFHDAGAQGAAAALLRSIASEQLVAWYLLHRLLSERWQDVFSKWGKELEEFGERLRKHDEYLRIAFEDMKQEIKKRADAGVTFRDCPSCGFASLELEEEVGNLFVGTCLVCNFNERCVSVECPECSATVTFLGGGYDRCENCGKEFDPEDLASLIEEDERGTKDYFESSMPAHCVDCDGYQTVVAHGGQYVCASCFNVYGDEDLHGCEYCGELNAGGLEDSFWKGCVACEGKAGYFRDKDD